MNQKLADKLNALISEIDTAAGMLIVASMKDATVRGAHEKLTNVSIQLGEIINNDI